MQIKEKEGRERQEKKRKDAEYLVLQVLNRFMLLPLVLLLYEQFKYAFIFEYENSNSLLLVKET